MHCICIANHHTTQQQQNISCCASFFVLVCFFFSPPAAYRNLGQNLWGPHRYGCLSGVQVRSVVSGPCAAHSLLITAEGKLWSWGEQSTKTPLKKTCKTLRVAQTLMIPIGRNEKGQLGHGDTKRVEAPKLIEVLGSEAIVLAACGRNHTLALTGTEKPPQNALKLLIFALVS